MVTVDELQWTEMSKMNSRIFELEQENELQQSLIVSTGQQLNRLEDLVYDHKAELDRLWSETRVIFDDTKEGFAYAKQVDDFLTDELVTVNTEVAQIGNYLGQHLGYVPTAPYEAGPSGTTNPDLGGGSGGGDWWSNLTSGLAGAGVGSIIVLALVFFIMMRKG